MLLSAFMGPKTFAFYIVLATPLWLLPPSAHAQTAEEVAGARALAQQGLTAFSEQRWQDAIDMFSRAETIVHAAPHQIYIARAYERLGRLVDARELYLKIVREQLPPDAPPAFLSAQQDARTELAAVEPRLGSVTIELSGPGVESATVTADGKPVSKALVGVARPIDPGEHVFEASGPGGQAEPVRLIIPEGSSQVVRLAMVRTGPAAAPAAAEASPEPLLPLPASAPEQEARPNIPMYAAFGVGGLGVIAGTVFLVIRSGQTSDADDRYDACARSLDCSPSEIDDIKSLDSDGATSGTLAIVGYGIGAAGIGAGLALLLLDEPSKTADTVGIRPWMAGHQLGVQARF